MSNTEGFYCDLLAPSIVWLLLALFWLCKKMLYPIHVSCVVESGLPRPCVLFYVCIVANGAYNIICVQERLSSVYFSYCALFL